jgi:hypothetical protein
MHRKETVESIDKFAASVRMAEERDVQFFGCLVIGEKGRVIKVV